MERKILRYSEMGPASFEIFEPAGKTFRLTPNWIILIMWSVTIFFFWVFDTAFPPHSDFRSIWLICVVLITLYYLVASFFTYKPLNGTIAGKIIFEIDSVIVNNKVFELRDITVWTFILEIITAKAHHQDAMLMQSCTRE
jgi:hypothetical protein